MKDFSSKMIGYFKIAIDSYVTNMKSMYDDYNSEALPWVLFVITDDERNVID